MLLELYLGPCKTSGIDIYFYEIVEYFPITTDFYVPDKFGLIFTWLFSFFNCEFIFKVLLFLDDYFNQIIWIRYIPNVHRFYKMIFYTWKSILQNLANFCFSAEAVIQSYSAKKVLLEISQNSQENTFARVFLQLY